MKCECPLAKGQLGKPWVAKNLIGQHPRVKLNSINQEIINRRPTQTREQQCAERMAQSVKTFNRRFTQIIADRGTAKRIEHSAKRDKELASDSKKRYSRKDAKGAKPGEEIFTAD